MSKITKPVMNNETGQRIADALETQNIILNTIAGAAIAQTTDLTEIQRIVKAGKADKNFNIGDQIVVPWTDIATGVTYEVPHDVVHMGNVTLRDGEEVPSMFLQWHYATPFGVQFDAREAFYVAPSEMSAGTYNLTFGTTWGHVTSGVTVQFTLANAVPEGGQIVFDANLYDVDPVGTNVSTYASANSDTPIETVALSSGSSGTSLGTITSAIKYATSGLNNLQRAVFGYNRWSMSAMRQFLNSDGSANAWWSGANPFDRKPNELATKHGFMSGYESDFLNILGEIKITTALNTVSDGDIEDDSLEDTFDTFFLPALINENITPQLAGEGSVWDYWKRASQSASNLSQYQTYPQMRTFAIENHSSPQYVRLRSSLRGYANDTWHVYSSGYVSYSGAVNSDRCAPVCAIC